MVLEDVCVSAGAPDLVEKICALVSDVGVAVVPDWTEARELSSRFDDLIERSRDARPASRPEEESSWKRASAGLSESASGLILKAGSLERVRESSPALAQVFEHEGLKSISRRLLGDTCSIHRQVILTSAFKPTPSVLPFHFDELRTIKFLVYATDVTDEEDAPFEFVPSTVSGSRSLRLHEWHRCMNYHEIRSEVFNAYPQEVIYTFYNDFPSVLERRMVRVPGNAGMMIVFDTDVIHRAGRLGANRHRKVVRTSSYPGFFPDRFVG